MGSIIDRVAVDTSGQGRERLEVSRFSGVGMGSHMRTYDMLQIILDGNVQASLVTRP